MRWSIHAALMATVCLAASAHDGFAQGLSPDEISQVEAAATETMERYYSLFSERNMQALPDEVFTIPWMTIGAGGVSASTTRDEALVRWQGSLINLLQQGWNRSVFTIETICALNAGAAIVSGYNTRYHEDGSEMSVGGVTYILSSTDDGWRIISYTGSTVGQGVTCG